MNAMVQTILSAGRARTLQELVPLFKEVRIARGINQRALDQAAGLADGLMGKIEVGMRGLGIESCDKLLSALGLELALVPRVDMGVIPKSKSGSASPVLATPREISCPIEKQKVFRVRRARKGGLSWASSRTARQRREAAMKAARAAGEVHKRKAVNRRAVEKLRARAAEAGADPAPAPQ